MNEISNGWYEYDNNDEQFYMLLAVRYTSSSNIIIILEIWNMLFQAL